MLINLREYQRPGQGEEAIWQRQRLDEVLALLARPDVRTVPLAGGDSLLAESDPAVEAVVDLQGLGLDHLAIEDDRLRIGALATRTALAGRGSELGRLGGLLAKAGARWAGSVQRNRATAGGAVAVAAANDPLVTALLACDATVGLYGRAGYLALSLAEFLPARQALLAGPALITDLWVTIGEAAVGTGLATVARTPADAPIVVASAVLLVSSGRCLAAHLALGGVAATPVALPGAVASLRGQTLSAELIATAAGAAAAAVQPADDFRGRAEYRQAMARVMSERALQEAWNQAA